MCVCVCEAHFAVRWLSVVHFVHSNDQLFHSESVGQESVLTSLAVLADSSLEFTSTRSHNQHSTVGLSTESRRDMFGFTKSSDCGLHYY